MIASISVLGGVFGLAAARWGLRAALATLAADLPRGDDIHVNASVLFFALGVSILVGILFGLAPALRSSSADLQPPLKSGTLAFSDQDGRRCASRLPAVAGPHPSDSGVQSAEITTEVPMTHQINSIPFWVDSHRPASVAEAPRRLGFITGPDFLQVMRIPLIRGRFISQQDTINSPLVAVIDSELARTYFPGKDPIGRTITFPQVGDYRIIGVVGHVQHWQVGFSSPFMQNQSYVSIYQVPDRWMTTIDTWTWAVVRTPLDASIVLPEIRKAVYRAASDQTVYHAQTMAEIVSESMSPQRFPLMMLGSFATLALLLASIGIYGVISYSVTQRVHEIGIRMALGAEKRDVFRMVVGQGLSLAFAGLAIGVTAALILMRILLSFSRLLYGVGASDPATLVSVSAVLIGVAFLACYLPARRAMRVDPIVALRYE